MKLVVKNEYIEYLVAFLVFLTIPPYFIWKYNYIQPIIIVLIIFFSFIRNKNIKLFNFCFCFILYLLYTYFAYRDGNNLIGIYMRGLPCFMFLFHSRYLSRIFEKFFRLYSIIMIPSIIVYIVIVFCGITLPSQTIAPINSLKDFEYIQYPFLLTSPSLDNMFRFMAYFDEPGVVGTISGILLFVSGFRFKEWETYPILISGILSFSLAFYILVLSYILLFESSKVKIATVCIAVVLVLILSENVFVYEHLFERMKIENGQLVGMNRTVSSMDSFMDNFKDSDKFWLGYGDNYAQIYVNSGGASYKDLIVNYGIIGFFLFLFIAIIKAIKELGVSKCLIIYILSFGSIVFQRPFIFSPIYLFLLFIPIFYLKEDHKKVYNYEKV